MKKIKIKIILKIKKIVVLKVIQIFLMKLNIKNKNK